MLQRDLVSSAKVFGVFLMLFLVCTMCINGLIPAFVKASPLLGSEQTALGQYPNWVASQCGASTNSSTTTATPAATTGGSVYMMGDSITFGSKDELTSAFTQAGFSSYVSARVSRSLSSPGSSANNAGTSDSYHTGLDQLRVDKDKIASANIVVIALGTNAEINGSFQDNVTAAISKIRAANPKLNSSNLYWVNLFSNVPDHKTEYNNTLNSLSSSLNFNVIDAASANISLSSDGIHPDASGQKTFSNLVVKALSNGGNPPSTPDTTSTCACTTTPDTSGSTLVGSNNVQKAWNFFKSKGLNDAQLAGLVGNLQDETGTSIDPELNQNGTGDTKTQPLTGGNDGWGIAQWTYPNDPTPVVQQMKQYKINGPIYELGPQLELVWAEMNGTSPNGVHNMYGSFKSINDPSQAASFFDNNFEGGNMDKRIIYAQALYANRDQLNKTTGSTPSAPSPNGAPVPAGSPANTSVATAGGSDTLEGHKLPATVGGTGDEDPVDASGHLTTTGGAVTFSQFGSLGQNYRDYYITMRWRYALWNWDGTSSTGPENSSWYGQKARLVLVTNPRNHKSIIADIMESGPAPWTGVDAQSNNSPKEGWSNPQDGTPAQYKGRVSGFPPVAIQALGAIQTTSTGAGDKLDYAWAPDQSAQPGPTTLQAGSGASGGGDCSASGTTNGNNYQNPFKDVPNIRQEGIDAGVDYNGDGPVHPIGPATVDIINGNSGWVGGNYVSYIVNGGPADNKVVFVGENCTVNSSLHSGQKITTSDTICTMNSKSTGIETGWANKGNDLPLPYTDKCYYLTNPSLPKTSTAYGVNFNQLMHSLGVPNASLLGGQVTCTLPNGWPKW